MKKENISWVCTDIDNEQYGFKVSEDVYIFKEKNRGLLEYEEDEVIQLTIVLSQYPKEKISNLISAYYSSTEEIQELYGEDANWIIAECIFEQETGLY